MLRESLVLRTILSTCAITCIAGGCGPDAAKNPDDPGAGADIVKVDEHEPNNGPDAAGAQDLGNLDADETLIIHGTLATGGSNGQQYTGDFDVFAIDVTAPGSIAIEVTWTSSADVDFGFYDANVQLVASEGAQAKPATGSVASASGKYLFALFSKDSAAPYTATLTYKKSDGGNTGGTCPTTPVLAAAPSGGCNITLTTPVCATADLTGGKVFELAWSTNQTFCEGPHTLYLAGEPSSTWQTGNAVSFQIGSTAEADARSGMTRNIGGYLNVNASDFAQLSSPGGIFHYRVVDFYGAASESRAFHVVK